MNSTLTLTRLQNLLWSLRGNEGGVDGSSWVPLQMMLLETQEPDASAYLLARVRAELLANCSHQRMLQDMGAIGPNVRSLMHLLKVDQAPAVKPQPKRKPTAKCAPSTVCSECGMRFTPNKTGRPRKRCRRCAPPI